MYKYVVLPPLNYTRFIPFLGVMVAEFSSLWQQNDTIQMLLCLIPPRCFAYPVSPCHRFRPFRCTSFLLFVVLSPHSSLLASAVTAVVLRVLMMFFLFLSAFLFNNHRKPAICPTAPPTARTLQKRAAEKSRPAISWSRTGTTPPSTSIARSGCGPPPSKASWTPNELTRSSGRPTSKSRRSRPQPSRTPSRTSRCAASYVSSQTSKTIYRRPPPITFKCRIPLKELDHLAVT